MVGTARSIDFVTMLVVGGEGTLIGSLIGVALLTMLPTLFAPLATYKTIASGAILIVALLYFPGGLLGGFMALLKRAFSKGRSARLREAA